MLVLLHEGLGCVSLWRDWPERLARESALGVLVYSRWGYGRSEPLTPPRPLTYMHEEGETTLPEALDAAGVREAVLPGCGHSPHRDRPEETTAAVVDFARRVLGR